MAFCLICVFFFSIVPFAIVIAMYTALQVVEYLTNTSIEMASSVVLVHVAANIFKLSNVMNIL